MRPIKFRAWGHFGSDKTDEMVYDWQDSEYIEYVGFDGGGYFDLMQFTGLLDKNGKEIYEGDIVDSSGTKGIVRLGDFGVSTDPGSGYQSVYGWFVKDGMDDRSPDNEDEVIGNIYENPELLKPNES